MLTEELLRQIGFEEPDIPYILACHRKYAPALASLAKDYTATFGGSERMPYPGDEREAAYTRAKQYAAAAIGLFPEEENPHILNLLAWLQLIPWLRERYEAHGFSEQLLYAALRDLPEKVQECKSVYGQCGVFSRWFFLFFDLKVFSLGRLHYEITSLEADHCTVGGVRLQRGDPVLSVHIPARGKLTPEACKESLAQAYDFFRGLFPETGLPIVCHSWLLYPPYRAEVFPPESNLSRFADLFRVLYADQVSPIFSDCWRVFGLMHEGSVKGFPADTRLRRNFLRYMEQNGDHGCGYGILLYDGKQKKILL